ncbi:hypothetical protein M885DRAFT_566935 [Pelagophyceae sp. CCMP2097]|nr:hypothetical protein M885DRAFT_566935 [Pelagophyceae sp. CCMP2097]
MVQVGRGPPAAARRVQDQLDRLEAANHSTSVISILGFGARAEASFDELKRGHLQLAAQRALVLALRRARYHCFNDMTALAQKAAPYVQHVKWEDDTAQMVCFVPSARDASYAAGRYPCLYGDVGIISKHGIQQLYKFVDESCRTATWQAQMADIDAVMLEARGRVAWDAGLRVPVAIAPPCGRPRKDAGTRLRFFYEHGQGGKRRKMHCGLCAGHDRTECSYRQVDDEASSSDDEDAVA